jgi:hypothetical protein
LIRRVENSHLYEAKLNIADRNKQKHISDRNDQNHFLKLAQLEHAPTQRVNRQSGARARERAVASRV